MTDAFTQLGQFHFLRPWWLLILLVLPVLYWLGQRANQNSSSWSQVINPQLLKYLLDDQQQRAKKWPLMVFILGCVLCLVALAGPTWKKMPQPVHQLDDALVIVLDLSLSMQATDINPSRLIATRHKLIDLLKARQQGQTALVVYAGDAHIVSPLTDDNKTIINMVPALSPLIMPALGSRPATGIELANQALKHGGINSGRILLITDGITNRDVDNISEQLKAAGNQLSILVVGTEQGGPIPIPEQGFLRDKGKIVIAKTNSKPLQKLAQITNAPIARLSLSDADIKTLLPEKTFDLNKSTHQVEREMDQWHEQGPWLILLLLPLAALAFRRGWLLSLLFVVLIQPTPVEAAPSTETKPSLLANLWLTPDQQAAKAFAEKHYQAAREHFTEPQWQGSAAYRAGDFETAAERFAQSDSASAHYNRGNALAKMGQLGEAIKAYDEALRRDPNLADAKANKTLLEKLAKQQQSESQDSNDNSNDNSDANSDKSSDQNSEQSSDQKQDQPSQDQQQNKNDNQQPNTESEQSKPDQEPSEQEQADQASKDEAEQERAKSKAEQANNQQNEPIDSEAQQLSEEQQQALEQWLRRIPDDPGLLLKRKFNYQYQQNRQDNQYVPQQEDETLW